MTSSKTLNDSVTGDENKEERSDSKKTDVSTPTAHADTTIWSGRVDRIIQNFRLVWLDSSIDEINNDDCIETIRKLREIVNAVKTFTNIDECTEFITNIENEKIFLIVSEALGETMVHFVHDKDQIHCFYIFCEHTERHEQWAKQWPKVKGVYTDITSICTALKQDTQECDQNLVSISFIKSSDGTSDRNLDQLGQSFMYNQILKDVLLTIDFDDGHINQFLTYCREHFSDNTTELANVEKLQQEYDHHQPIWWYTYDSFLYSMLNRVLRLIEVDLIIKMGFFLQDLHYHIAALHAEQYDQHHRAGPFIVYRGQGLPQTVFDQLQKTQGGWLSFNNFLSTSQNKDISLEFTRQTMATSSLVGVLFVLKIDPSIPSTPFANVRTVGDYQEGQEILFSMYSIFRIGQVTKIDNDDRLWQVDLTLTSDNDPQLHALTDCIRDKVEEVPGWPRLGELMIRLGRYREARDFYETLLAQTADERERGEIYNQLGNIESSQAEYTKAIIFFNKSLIICQNALTSQHPEVADCYDNIGNVHFQMGRFKMALVAHQKALDIREQVFPPDHPDLAISYNNIGLVYDSLCEYSKALSSYEKALEIYQTTLPPNHSDLATTYNNIALVHGNMEEYSKALALSEKALEIRQTALPSNHPDLATSYVYHAFVCEKMGEYAKALSYYEKALEIDQTALTRNHPDLVNSYNNIGSLYNKMEEYSKALFYCEKALEIRQTTLSPDHPDLATSYNNIALVCNKMGEHSKALSYYEKALEIDRTTLSPDHPYLTASYNNIGAVYDKIGEYSKALSYYENAVEIYQISPFPNYPHLATSYNSIGSVYDKMNECSKALLYYEKVLEIRQTILPSDDPDLATSYNNIASVYDKMDEHSKALYFYERALDILERSPSPGNDSLEHLKERIDVIKKLEINSIVCF